MSAQPNDDLMAMADAVGVNARPAAKPLHPSLRGHCADEALAQLIDNWAAEAPIPFEVDACPLCNDTGIYETRSALGGGQVHVTCPVCPRDHDQDGDR